MQLKRVVVTGLGALTPIGNNIQEYWEGLITGKSGAAPITYYDTEKHKTKFACEVKNFNIEDYMDRKESRRLDKFAQYAIAASDEAIKDAGITSENVNKQRVGVIWGAGIGGLETFQDEVMYYAKGDGTPKFNPFFIPKMIADIAPAHISMRNGYMGPNYTTVSACASSANAMIDAFNYIRLGLCDVIISGGSEAAVTIAGMGGFNSMHALSTRNESPETASRPFDVTRDGFVLGEGAGALVLEEYEHAKARGAKILAEITGYGATSDGYDMVAPSGEGAVRCMKMSMQNLRHSKIDYINTHGTSTPVGDTKEIEAMKEVFKDKVPPFSSTKSITGHSLGATSVQEAIYCLLMMKNKFIAASANVKDLDEKIKGLPIVTEVKKNVDLNCVMSNSFGFGGTNATLVFESI